VARLLAGSTTSPPPAFTPPMVMAVGTVAGGDIGRPQCRILGKRGAAVEERIRCPVHTGHDRQLAGSERTYAEASWGATGGGQRFASI
jgi:hypothetical protein